MIESLIENNRAELTQGTKKVAPVVLSTRIRLARNLADSPFPERANLSQRSEVLKKCQSKLMQLAKLKSGFFYELGALNDLEKWNCPTLTSSETSKVKLSAKPNIDNPKVNNIPLLASGERELRNIKNNI